MEMNEWENTSNDQQILRYVANATFSFLIYEEHQTFLNQSFIQTRDFLLTLFMPNFLNGIIHLQFLALMYIHYHI